MRCSIEKYLPGIMAGIGLLLWGVCVVCAPLRLAACGHWLRHHLRQTDAALHLARMEHTESPMLRACTRQEPGVNAPELWIAHGGGVGEWVYTNSLEAVQDSLRRGFRYVELDLLVTTDGHLVGGHDWPRLRRMAGLADTEDAPVSRAELLAARACWQHTLLFAGDICRLMEENPHMVLVTDKVQDFELLLREIPYAERMVVEASNYHNYLKALQAGVKNVTFSVWTAEGLRQARQFRLPGVVLASPVMMYDLSVYALVEQMHREGCCIMVHGSSLSDKPQFIYRYLGRCISRVYTDTWSPAAVPPAP